MVAALDTSPVVIVTHGQAIDMSFEEKIFASESRGSDGEETCGIVTEIGSNLPALRKPFLVRCFGEPAISNKILNYHLNLLVLELPMSGDLIANKMRSLSEELDVSTTSCPALATSYAKLTLDCMEAYQDLHSSAVVESGWLLFSSMLQEDIDERVASGWARVMLDHGNGVAASAHEPASNLKSTCFNVIELAFRHVSGESGSWWHMKTGSDWLNLLSTLISSPEWSASTSLCLHHRFKLAIDAIGVQLTPFASSAQAQLSIIRENYENAVAALSAEVGRAIAAHFNFMMRLPHLNPEIARLTGFVADQLLELVGNRAGVRVSVCTCCAVPHYTFHMHDPLD